MERRRFWSLFFAAAGLIVLYCVLHKLSVIGQAVFWVLGIFSPIYVGLIVAFVLNLPMRALEKLWDRCDLGIRRLCRGKKKNQARPEVGKISRALRRPFCLLVAILIILAILVTVVARVLPELGKTVVLIVNGVPDYLKEVQKWTLQYANEYPTIYEMIAGLNIDWEETKKTIFSFIGSGTLDFVGTTFMSVVNALGGVFDFVISLIFAIYVLLSKETLSRQIKRLLKAYLPQRIEQGILHVAQTAHGIFCSFVAGQCIEAVILGSLCTIGMVIFRFPYAAMIGVLVGVTALIPVVGAFIGAGVGAFLILMMDPFQALMFLIYIVVLQQIEGNVIYPRVVGTSVGLPAMWVLAAVTVGGGISGIVGMLFAVPTASVLYTLLRENIAKRLEKKKREKGHVEE